MLAGNEREALLRVAEQLSIELGHTEGKEVPEIDSALGGKGPMAGILNSEDELLVATVRRGLAMVAAALGGLSAEGITQSAVAAALDGAEMVMRGELISGNGAQLPTLMPSFVFLVVLPVADQDRALQLSRRTEQLVNGALG